MRVVLNINAARGTTLDRRVVDEQGRDPDGKFASGGGSFAHSTHASNAGGKSAVKLDLRKPFAKQYISAGMSREEAHADMKKRGYNDAVIAREMKGFDRAEKGKK